MICSAFAEGLYGEACRMQMQIERYAPPIFIDCPTQRLKTELSRQLDDMRKQGFQLVIVVISGYNSQVYGG